MSAFLGKCPHIEHYYISGRDHSKQIVVSVADVSRAHTELAVPQQSLQQFLGLTALSLSNEIEDLVGSFPQPFQLVSLSDKFTTPYDNDQL